MKDECFYFEEFPIAVKVKLRLTDWEDLDKARKFCDDPKELERWQPFLNVDCFCDVVPNEKINFTNLDRWWSAICSQIPRDYPLLLVSGKSELCVLKDAPIPNLLSFLRKKKHRAKLGPSI